MTINIHILNSSGKLDLIYQKIETAFSKSIKIISDLLPADNIDVVIQSGSTVIPEIGLCGYSPNEDILYITVDPKNKNLHKNFNTEFLAALGHELHHCLRHKSIGYGETLSEALISEGLACHFESELRRGKAPFYAKALKDEIIEDIWKKATVELDSSSYNHSEWFFGSLKRSIPNHAGYSLGFNKVSKYILKCGIPASKLWATPSSEFYTKV